MLVLRTLLVYLITLAIKACDGELNTTKKCDEGWQGKDCEFCAGKIRYIFGVEKKTFHISTLFHAFLRPIMSLITICLLTLRY